MPTPGLWNYQRLKRDWDSMLWEEKNRIHPSTYPESFRMELLTGMEVWNEEISCSPWMEWSVSWVGFTHNTLNKSFIHKSHMLTPAVTISFYTQMKFWFDVMLLKCLILKYWKSRYMYVCSRIEIIFLYTKANNIYHTIQKNFFYGYIFLWLCFKYQN